MGLNIGDVITASDFVALKARVKAECERRKYNGSVESYAGSEYDYTVAPQTGNVPLPEHFNKIIIPMNAMVDTGRTATQNGYLVWRLQSVDTALTELEEINATDPSSGCRASCTGLCQGTCATGCSGCTGDCTGTCSTTCTGTCGGSCTGSCTGGCSGSCGSECAQSCTSSCYTLCTNGCKGNCKGTCGNSCTSCTGSCAGYCTASGGSHPVD